MDSPNSDSFSSAAGGGKLPSRTLQEVDDTSTSALSWLFSSVSSSGSSVLCATCSGMSLWLWYGSGLVLLFDSLMIYSFNYEALA